MIKTPNILWWQACCFYQFYIFSPITQKSFWHVTNLITEAIVKMTYVSQPAEDACVPWKTDWTGLFSYFGYTYRWRVQLYELYSMSWKSFFHSWSKVRQQTELVYRFRDSIQDSSLPTGPHCRPETQTRASKLILLFLSNSTVMFELQQYGWKQYHYITVYYFSSIDNHMN